MSGQVLGDRGPLAETSAAFDSVPRESSMPVSRESRRLHLGTYCIRYLCATSTASFSWGGVGCFHCVRAEGDILKN